MSHDEIVLKQSIVALSLTLNFTAHSKNECLMCMTSEGAENVAMRVAEELAGGDVEFPCALYGGRLGLILAMDDYEYGQCVFYDDFDVYQQYTGNLTATGEYMTLEYYNEGYWMRDNSPASDESEEA